MGDYVIPWVRVGYLVGGNVIPWVRVVYLVGGNVIPWVRDGHPVGVYVLCHPVGVEGLSRG